MVKMSELTESDVTKSTTGLVSQESVLIKTVRSTINLVTNVLMLLTVFVSFVYSCSYKITEFHLHIILCVLGYQFFMCQGTLVLSKYNSWSMYLTRRQKKHLHLMFQLISFILIVAGSVVIMKEEQRHFNSAHGSLGVVALIFSIVTVINGAVANYAYKLINHVCVIKFVHYLSGALTLLLSAGALTTGFSEFPFQIWLKNDNAIAGLIIITWVFTLLVVIDFWLQTAQRFRTMCVHSK